MNSDALIYDILKELFNISVGKAASILSEITNKKILLDVPNVEILNFQDEKFKVNGYLPDKIDGTLMVSSISFEKKLEGKANLIFPAKKMRTFINLCLNDEQENSEYYNMNFTDIDFDTVKEIGNIILNCILGEVGNYLNINLIYTLPEVKVFNAIDFSKDIENEGYIYTLILYITFLIDDVEIEGAVIIDLTLKSLNELIKKIDEVRDELYE